MKASVLFHSTIVVLGLVSASVTAGTWSFINLTGDDFETGIDPSRTYTHLVDFGPDATAAAINGVQFTAKGRTGVNYSLVGVEGDFVNNANALASGATGLGDLLTDFYYGEPTPPGVQTLTLTGLREAHTYRLTFFVSSWGGADIDFTASDDPGVTYRISRDGLRWSPDPADLGYLESTGAGSPGAAISYDYVAPADGTFVMVLNTTSEGNSFHHYGFVNELVAIPGDSDADGMPDIYEEANGLNPLLDDAAADLDNDGLTNIEEYTLGTKANNPDTDADGLKDGVETDTGTYVSAADTGTDPLNPDTDGDGLLDGVESNSGKFVNAADPGTHPLKADTDADGFADGFEAQRGYDPNSANSTPESDLSIRTAIEFRFNAASGVSYRIEGSADLVAWTTIENNITGQGATVTRFYSTETTPIRFYRWARN